MLDARTRKHLVLAVALLAQALLCVSTATAALPRQAALQGAPLAPLDDLYETRSPASSDRDLADDQLSDARAAPRRFHTPRAPLRDRSFALFPAPFRGDAPRSVIAASLLANNRFTAAPDLARTLPLLC